MQIDSISVDMLGGFSVRVNGQTVVKGEQKLTKPWQLFCYLLLHRERFVPSRRLMAVLWADDALADPANVLKNAVYSLRKDLCGGESATDSPIIYSDGGYRFDPDVKLELDVDGFVALCGAAAAEADGEQKAALCRKAVLAYAGEFLPRLDQDLWVVPLALEYKRKYIQCSHELCAYLWRTEAHRELLDTATAAVAADPLDEQSNVYLFRAMDALKMYRVIVTTYSRLARLCEDTLSAKPPADVQQIYHAASERIHKTEQDIIVIKSELSGSAHASRPQRGAYYCGYSTLRHMYGLMKRAAERNNQTLVLALFTLSPARGEAAPPIDLTRAMAEFKVVAMNNLRKADAISRYSGNQYAMLLSVTSLDDGRLVRNRILENFAHAAAGRGTSVDVKLAEV